MNFPTDESPTERTLPLHGVRVLEIGHTILGPSCGMLLADLGADVVKIEPPGGERTRRLKGFGTGYFGFFNRNKRSVEVDYKTADGLAEIRRAILDADVLIENMGPGALRRAGIGPEEARALNPRLVYCSLKGFLPGPYDTRAALDEVVQMMSGLAYMTGPPGRPLRAGTSITDILGGVFGAVGILAALRERDVTGEGTLVQASLFETAAFLMGQHMAYAALGDGPVPPMPARVSAWAVYELFETADDEHLFVGITSDAHWTGFCRVFERDDLAAAPELATNELRIDARPRLIPEVAAMLRALPVAELEKRCHDARLPYARIARPEDLFEDPHLMANGSLADTTLPSGVRTRLPKLPIRLGGRPFGLRRNPPAGPEARGWWSAL
ncbi:CaiB/BaiF CoA transferase family protein [Streptomyces iranensis]|uniref:Crotonobetainyl-CoA:carnitine CoA-transferase CaiB-like acyl-CoA transferase n=1 Tax=Streptomyces iranensis TaxID=576784 RepID=A0A060ZYT1_9ACTN|nr:CoA transferase [Streptomyces iranensis]MBP2066148.1 crotonobetainyl-CoA:carnitine CoA-transferase CaiB-like acyl-CoA transferase [Streptomyces iranensis]CDR13210.1 L-carnitine dehydratase/bile acid-inducibleprotein F [Streptomyces iranensis]